MEQDKTIGAITWMDITVPEADGLRDFYKNVMVSPSDNVVRSGVCHAAGANAGMPAAWIMYINVANLDECIAKVIAGGGEVVNGPRKMGEKARYCIIKDPAGAYCGLFDHGEE